MYVLQLPKWQTYIYICGCVLGWNLGGIQRSFEDFSSHLFCQSLTRSGRENEKKKMADQILEFICQEESMFEQLVVDSDHQETSFSIEEEKIGIKISIMSC